MAPQKKGSAAGAGGAAPGPAGELERLLAAHPRTEFIDPLVADLCGGFRAKRMPIDQAGKLFSQGIEIPYALHLIDATGDSCDPLGIGIGNGAPDGTAMPIANTLAPIPWSERPGAQVLLTFFEPDRRRSRADPRWVLEGVLNRYRAARLHPVAAVEYEFYLIDRGRDAAGRPQPPLRPGTNVRETGNQPYLVDDLDAYGQILGEIGEGCRVQGIGATTSISEFAPGQFEINLQHRDDILRVADEAALFRRVVKAVARRHGMEATFMPKPYGNQTGSGQHVHLSLLDDSGRNLFDDGSGAGSMLLRSAIAGLAATMREGHADLRPQLHQLPPLRCQRLRARQHDLGLQQPLRRLPRAERAGREPSHRAPRRRRRRQSLSRAAAVLAGVLHGIEGRLEPGAPSKGNVCTVVDPDLPLTVPAALQALRNAAVLPQWLGAEYLALYAAVKEGEYAKFMGEAFEREYAWYL